MKTLSSAGIILALFCIGTGDVHAIDNAFPQRISGFWSGFSNQTAVTAVFYESVGTPGSCDTLTGTFGGNPVQGYYCPLSGRVGFAIFSGGQPFEVCSGTLTQSGSTNRITGWFAYFTTPRGEYSFMLSK